MISLLIDRETQSPARYVLAHVNPRVHGRRLRVCISLTRLCRPNFGQNTRTLANYGIAVAELCEEGCRVACMSHVGAGRIVDPESEPFLAWTLVKR